MGLQFFSACYSSHFLLIKEIGSKRLAEPHSRTRGFQKAQVKGSLMESVLVIQKMVDFQVDGVGGFY